MRHARPVRKETGVALVQDGVAYKTFRKFETRLMTAYDLRKDILTLILYNH